MRRALVIVPSSNFSNGIAARAYDHILNVTRIHPSPILSAALLFSLHHVMEVIHATLVKVVRLNSGLSIFSCVVVFHVMFLISCLPGGICRPRMLHFRRHGLWPPARSRAKAWVWLLKCMGIAVQLLNRDESFSRAQAVRRRMHRAVRARRASVNDISPQIASMWVRNSMPFPPDY